MIQVRINMNLNQVNGRENRKERADLRGIKWVKPTGLSVGLIVRVRVRR